MQDQHNYRCVTLVGPDGELLNDVFAPFRPTNRFKLKNHIGTIRDSCFGEAMIDHKWVKALNYDPSQIHNGKKTDEIDARKYNGGRNRKRVRITINGMRLEYDSFDEVAEELGYHIDERYFQGQKSYTNRKGWLIEKI